MLRVRAVPSLALVLAGCMDWFTTVIGIVYFGAVEGNPFLAELTRTSLPVFTTVKLSTTIIIGLLFYKADKMLLRTQQDARSFRAARIILRAAYITATALLLIAVFNNLSVVVKTI